MVSRAYRFEATVNDVKNIELTERMISSHPFKFINLTDMYNI